MVKLYHITHYAEAEEAFRFGRLESEPEKRLRILTERLGSHAKAEEFVKNSFGKNRYSRIDEWFRENYLFCQTQLRPEKSAWITNEGTKDRIVIFEFELDGYIAAENFDFPNSSGMPIRTVLSKDPCDQEMEYAIHEDRIGIQSANLEHLITLIVSPGILADTKIALENSEHEYLKKFPVNILHKKDRQWYSIRGI